MFGQFVSNCVSNCKEYWNGVTIVEYLNRHTDVYELNILNKSTLYNKETKNMPINSY